MPVVKAPPGWSTPQTREVFEAASRASAAMDSIYVLLVQRRDTLGSALGGIWPALPFAVPRISRSAERHLRAAIRPAFVALLATVFIFL